MARKMNGKGKNRVPKAGFRHERKLQLTKADLIRGQELGATVDREKNPTMLVYFREPR